jgi:hypothetical protein
MHYLKVDFSILSPVTTLRFDNELCFENTEVSTLHSLEQSPFRGITSYLLSDINAESTALPKETFCVHFHVK